MYTAKEFGESLEHFDQKITHRGVVGHHHNGVAKAKIGSILQRARILMFHAALLWPEMENKALWPMVMQHAVYLHNHTPSSETRLAPIELWTQSKISLSAIKNVLPCGSPTYVLQARFQWTESPKVGSKV